MAWLGITPPDAEGPLSTPIAAVRDRKAKGTWVWHAGYTHFIADECGGRGKKKTAAHSGDVLAPLTGKILEVSVAVGDAVRPGDVLVVLEAMKMEYRLEAKVTGTVEAMELEVGQLVDKGSIVVRVTPAVADAAP